MLANKKWKRHTMYATKSLRSQWNPLILRHIQKNTLHGFIISSSSSASSTLKPGRQLLVLSIITQQEQLFDGDNVAVHSRSFYIHDFFLGPARLFPCTKPIIIKCSSGYLWSCLRVYLIPYKCSFTCWRDLNSSILSPAKIS